MKLIKIYYGERKDTIKNLQHGKRVDYSEDTLLGIIRLILANDYTLSMCSFDVNLLIFIG